MQESKHSRLPVYDESLDHIVGVLHQKDFFHRLQKGPCTLQELMKKPLFVPETAQVSTTLKLMQRTRSQMAVVADEYGGTAGIVTMEDILEELVGEIWDEHDEEEVFIHKVDKGTYLVDAAMDFDDFAEFFHLNEETEMTSVSGWVMEQCDRVPEVGDRFSCQDLDVLVTRVDNHRTCEIKVVRREASGGEITDET